MINLQNQNIQFIGEPSQTLKSIAESMEKAGGKTFFSAPPTTIHTAIIAPQYFQHQHFMEATPENISTAFEHNFKFPTLQMQAVAKNMIANRIAGSIIVLSSVVSLEPHARTNLTGSSLAALEVIAHMAAVDLGPSGIRVNIVAAGWLDPDWSTPLRQKDGTFRNPGDIPLEKHGDLADLGATCCFLASEQAKYITGATIKVDGGYSLTRSAKQTPYAS